MEQTMLEKEITIQRFLHIFMGISPSITKNITHEDASKLFSELESFSDREFWKKCKREELINFVRVKDKNKKVKYYRKPLVLEDLNPNQKIKEATLKGFLGEYLGINPSYTRNWTHKDALMYYKQINALTEEEYEKLDDPLKTTDYVKVTDTEKKVLYYDKVHIYETENDENLQRLITHYEEINLDGLEKWELLELRKDLKRIKKHNQQVLDRQLSNISKQLTKRKKANYND